MKMIVLKWFQILFFLSMVVVVLSTTIIVFPREGMETGLKKEINEDSKNDKAILAILLKQIDAKVIHVIRQHPWILARIKKIERSSRTYKKLRLKYLKYVYGKDISEIRKGKLKYQHPFPIMDLLYLSQHPKRD